ncbi:hypothetical protein C8Q70DRAFT_921621 [Cubamyces menziesii]|nr:hypothetical protein C8Q70DRAFT_921621 [Cubamyces menziesii]
MVSVLAANLVSMYIECALYGIFFLLSFSSLGLLVHRKRASCRALCTTPRLSVWPHRIAFALALLKSPLITANILLILTITVHWLIGMRRFFIAIVNHKETKQAGDFLENLSEGLEIARTAVLFVDMLLGDIVITYRTWLVWRRDHRVVIIPCFTIAGLVASGIGLLYVFKTLNPSAGIFASTLGPWVLGYCVATSGKPSSEDSPMIAYKICSINHLTRKTGLMQASGGSLLVTIFVESAALYSTWATLFVIFYLTRSPLQTVGSGCGPSMIGISFMLITVRVGLGWSQESKFGAGPALPGSGRGGHGPGRSLIGGGGAGLSLGSVRFGEGGESTIPMQTITFDVAQSVEQEADYALECKSPADPHLGRGTGAVRAFDHPNAA